MKKETTVTNNAMVRSTKQTVTDEEGKTIKELYNIIIQTEKGVVTISSGEKNWKAIKEITT